MLNQAEFPFQTADNTVDVENDELALVWDVDQREVVRLDLAALGVRDETAEPRPTAIRPAVARATAPVVRAREVRG